MSGSVIVSFARTPIGKMSGVLAGFSATDLGGVAIRAALERAGIDGPRVDYVVMGHVLQAGQGQITARQAAVNAGIPMGVPALTVNKVCLSGINSIYLADQMIAAGDAEIVVAGGMESMTNAPYLLAKARGGYRMGNDTLIDSMIHDGLWCAFEMEHMGEGTQRYADEHEVSRDAQDELALKSHSRAADAIKHGRFADEIAEVAIPQRKGDPVVVDTDEGVRAATTLESLGALRPAFVPDGTVTAGNASQLSDGAAAMVIMSKPKADELGVTPLAEVIGYGMVAGPDVSLLHQPSRAIMKALDKVGMSVSDIDLFELSEAFAAVGVASMRDLGISDEIVNVNGGAIALGHPVGMSGTRIVGTLVNELRRRGGGVGAAALCGGGGQGDAALIRAI
ncbi:MAG TPA: acetyl-CoA C-acetyltransferase [Microthrixaceae bacterium]|nr:acetyl-CoA C-acetyltransferase [Microthrixaceae bacterium]MCB9376662.1 acetyl-CoA C-acetyltransferase [Microthrixaceae bacterium]MCO5307100.1 acetyl-CoA C-acetyltransferase [Microthrixaceae bacterium]HNI34879.1 acetyl-CoA C-acetyltransferase [Microthrixaceae bacterium]